MRKLLKTFLVLFLLIGSIQISSFSIKGTQRILESFEIVNFNGELNSGVKNEIKIETKINKFNVENFNFILFYKSSDNVIYSMDGQNGFTIPDCYKYANKNYEFLCLQATYYNEVNGKAYGPEYYSYKYSKDELLDIISNCSEFSNPHSPSEYPNVNNDSNVYMLDNDLSFTLKDANIDKNAPSIEGLNWAQVGNEIEFSFETDEANGAGLDYMWLSFVSTTSSDEYYMDFTIQFKNCKIDKINENKLKISGKFNLNTGLEKDLYLSNGYGTYNLTTICIYDMSQNMNQLFVGNDLPQVSIELSKANNERENNALCNYTYKIKTIYEDNKLHYRKDKKNEIYGSNMMSIQVFNEQGEEMDYGESLYVAQDCNIDVTVEGEFTYSYKMMYPIHFDRNEENVIYKEISIDFPVVVEDVQGTLEASATMFDEICITKDQMNDTLNALDTVKEYQVKLKHGETTTKAYADELYNTIASENDVAYIRAGGYYFYDPKYIINNKENSLSFPEGYSFIGCYVKHDLHIYVQDEYGNLLNHFGRVVVKYEDRKDIKHKTNNDNVNVQSLEGTLPTYSTVNSKEVDASDLFDNTSQAYDITMDTEEDTNIQPVGDVNVTITLNDSLKGKDVAVYYVDDDGNQELVNSTSNGEEVVFTTDHFSTYAIVDKNASTGSLPNTGKPNNNVIIGTNTDNVIDNNTVEKGPDTSDASNVQFYFSIMLISFITIVSYKGIKLKSKS